MIYIADCITLAKCYQNLLSVTRSSIKMRSFIKAQLLAGIFAGAGVVRAQANNTVGVESSAKAIAESILETYNNGSTPTSPGFIPGLFPEEYYWWESGLAWDTLINYWAYAGDDALVETIQQGLSFQVGAEDNFMPPNQTATLGNDDQSFWALAAMSAAEHGLPVPSGSNVTWYELARNAFDTQVARWDEDACAGGLRWQIFTFNNGYNYKNALTQANFAQLGARLWKYTSNATYLEQAARAVEWSTNVGLISATDNSGAIYDGTDVAGNCSNINRIQWSINAGQFMSAFAHACNGTCSDEWQRLGDTVLDAVSPFAVQLILTETACSGQGRCSTDQLAFRAPLARALANARDMAGVLDDAQKFNTERIIAASAAGAQAQCSSSNGCGSDWSSAEWDGTSGLGQDLAALEILLATYPRKQLLTLNTTTGGATSGPNGGNGGSNGGGNGTSPAEAPGNAAPGIFASSIMGSIMVASLTFGASFLL
jgi:mannan endo-1,6-alpha-mannosidase